MWGGIALTLLLRNRAKAATSYPAPAPYYAVVQGGKVSSRYLKKRGYRKDNTEIRHLGVDIKAPKDTPIRAVSDGTIEKFWTDGQVYGYGNLLLIANNDGTGSLYAHLNSFGDIYEGMPVKQGEVVGYVGQTQAPRPEMKTAPHLHLEIHKFVTTHINPNNPPRLDPIDYINNQGMTVG